MRTAPIATRSTALAALVLPCLAILVLSAVPGCRSTRDNQIDILESELRSQEDYIYELEDYVLEYSEKLRECRCTQPGHIVSQSSSPEPELVGAPLRKKPNRDSADKQLTEDAAEEFPGSTEPTSEPDDTSAPLPDEMDIPELELESVDPVGDSDQQYSPDPDDAASDSDTRSTQDQQLEPSQFQGELPAEASPDADSRVAQRLVITKVLRGEGGGESPASLLTIVEARDANDEPVDFDGKASLMVMTTDPESPARLKRWDFTAEETASAWQTSQLGDGLHLELPLGESALPDEAVELWVRLIADDGRKLLTQLPFQREKLTTVDFELQAQKLLSDQDTELADTGAQPLPQQHASEPERKHSNSEAAQDQSKWRSAMQRTHALDDGYASTARTSKGWTSQPEGGREPLSPASVSKRAATTVGQSSRSSQPIRPVWTAGRSSDFRSIETK